MERGGFEVLPFGTFSKFGSNSFAFEEDRDEEDSGEFHEFEVLTFELRSRRPTLRRGSRGAAVSDLQRRLNLAGFSVGAADGIFGSRTDTAVRGFQRARRLSVDGVVGSSTWSALLNIVAPSPSPGGSGSIRYGKGWGGSEGVADSAVRIARSMDIPITSTKRNRADTIRVGSSTGSDHYTGNTTAYAVDFGVSGLRGDSLANAIAQVYGIPTRRIGTYDRTYISVDDRRYRLQLLWRVSGHFDHVHLGIRRL